MTQVSNEMGAGDVTTMMMAVGNMYGILLLVVLMGSGLVALPRRMWQLSFPRAELVRLFFAATAAESDFNDARYALEDCEREVATALMAPRHSDVEERDEISGYLERVSELVQTFDFSRRSRTNRSLQDAGSQLGTDVPLARDADGGAAMVALVVDLHARVKTGQDRVRACERRWATLLRRVRSIETALGVGQAQVGVALTDMGSCGQRPKSDSWSNMPTESGVVGGDGWARALSALRSTWWWCQGICGCLAGGVMASPFTPTSRMCLRVSAVVCALFSVVVLYSQVVAAISMDSLVGVLLNTLCHSSVGVQLVSFLALAYMSLCSFYSLFTLKIGYDYTLQGPHQVGTRALEYRNFCRQLVSCVATLEQPHPLTASIRTGCL